MEKTLALTTERRETPKTEIFGVGAVIINAYTGEIWGITERANKAKTGRIQGQLSIPLETRKVDETVIDNLLGAVAEAFDDDGKLQTVGALADDLVYLEGERFDTRVKVPGIVCNYGVLLYTGSAMPKQPFNALEVGDARWITPGAFLEEGVRPLAKTVISDVLDSGRYAKSLADFRDPAHGRCHLFDKDFSIRANYQQREKKIDIG